MVRDKKGLQRRLIKLLQEEHLSTIDFGERIMGLLRMYIILHFD
jgi:hypothetical protein